MIRAQPRLPAAKGRRDATHAGVAGHGAAGHDVPAVNGRAARIPINADQTTAIATDAPPARATIATTAGTQIQDTARGAAGEDRRRSAAHIVNRLETEVRADELVDIGPGQGIVLHRQPVFFDRGRPIAVERDTTHADRVRRNAGGRVRPDAGDGADLAKRNIEPVISGRSNRRMRIEHDRTLYKQRNRIGRMFGHLKIIRAIATRYDQLASSFLGMVHLATARYWLEFVHAA
nr:transposase [Sphingomonas sp. 8AM]